MSFNDLQDKWLFVAYSAKRDGSEDADIIKNDSYRDKIKIKDIMQELKESDDFLVIG